VNGRTLPFEWPAGSSAHLDTAVAPAPRTDETKTASLGLTPDSSKAARHSRCAAPSQEITVEMPGWLRWLCGARSRGAKADDRQDVRRQTDQKLKREKAEKQQEEARDRPNSRRGDEQT
jgi:hypothetical protein